METQELRLLALGCSLLVGCAKHSEPPPPVGVDASVVVADAAPIDAGLAALSGHEWLEQLDLGDGEIAFVSLPLGATEPRPLMIAVHGAGDRPEWACGGWRGVSGNHPFIVCPRGTAAWPGTDGRRNWPTAASITKIVDLAIPVVRARYGAYVAPGPMIYAGFSRGAILGAEVVRDRGAEFPLLVMSEGGYDNLGEPLFAVRYAKSGGKRVLLGCSHFGCKNEYARAVTNLSHAGIDVKINDAGNIGHNLNGEVVKSLYADWPWLTR